MSEIEVYHLDDEYDSFVVGVDCGCVQRDANDAMAMTRGRNAPHCLRAGAGADELGCHCGQRSPPGGASYRVGATGGLCCDLSRLLIRGEVALLQREAGPQTVGAQCWMM